MLCMLMPAHLMACDHAVNFIPFVVFQAGICLCHHTAPGIVEQNGMKIAIEDQVYNIKYAFSSELFVVIEITSLAYVLKVLVANGKVLSNVMTRR